MIYLILLAIYGGGMVAVVEATVGKKAAYTALNVLLSMAIFLGCILSGVH